jgi:hypothetical protein
MDDPGSKIFTPSPQVMRAGICAASRSTRGAARRLRNPSCDRDSTAPGSDATCPTSAARPRAPGERSPVLLQGLPHRLPVLRGRFHDSSCWTSHTASSRRSADVVPTFWRSRRKPASTSTSPPRTRAPTARRPSPYQGLRHPRQLESVAPSNNAPISGCSREPRWFGERASSGLIRPRHFSCSIGAGLGRTLRIGFKT